jgi:hypothetical protein
MASKICFQLSPVDIDVVVLLIVRHIHGLLVATTDRFPELSCD